ncbi:hypothetical protein MATR_10290 [Marivirga tractuosa]|uniref:Uncharacterized protein n=1 Tax=Marivirga tractuosa (strain ATCC 23168 / DSM 4126 / NBRC 15989 / NCIMB 1408 / VKM B-1430 / H-43) TaxID=643867 RepID=E4TM66_MARTH|nr:hypothetical protein [Marivirga tractuosa]ADR21342.1 hypothetical protein Ftrac_1352 [Marivirga tractuosa DSM 4126]BDD14204.1 hypothetical protein MATR_10290 [Marivirga tractuosa]
METHKIDQLFKQKLDRYSEPVSADAFAKVQAQMKGKKQKKGFPWMIAASVSILLVLSFGLVYNFNQSEEVSLAKIELNNAQLSFAENDGMAKPEIVKEEPKQIAAQKQKVAPSVKSFTQEKIVVEDFNRMASIEKVKGFEADLNIDRIPELKLSPQKHENKVIVEIHYAYAESKKEENLIVKSNNKLKSLASEFSLAELRSAKNELFASALQFNRKGNN